MDLLDEIFEQLDFVDDPDVLALAKQNPALQEALEMSRPENWWGIGLKPEAVFAVAEEDGIPVAWTPPREVLKALVAARSGDRIKVLTENEDVILSHCRELLAACHDPWLANEYSLLDRALDAFGGGHFEAAMALAVVVGEGLAFWASEPRVQTFFSDAEAIEWKRAAERKYSLAAFDLDRIRRGKRGEFQIARRALIGPIPHFFTPYFPGHGDVLPSRLSRHAAVHTPTTEHYSRQNALVVLMLCISILREQQEWCEEVRIDDGEFAD